MHVSMQMLLYRYGIECCDGSLENETSPMVQCTIMAIGGSIGKNRTRLKSKQTWKETVKNWRSYCTWNALAAVWIWPLNVHSRHPLFHVNWEELAVSFFFFLGKAQLQAMPCSLSLYILLLPPTLVGVVTKSKVRIFWWHENNNALVKAIRPRFIQWYRIQHDQGYIVWDSIMINQRGN